MALAQCITDLVGNTPLLTLGRLAARHGITGQLLGKLEGCNPAGSSKARVALSMISDGEARGLLRHGAAIIEPTSGNTGIGLAAIGVPRGYRVLLTMPKTMSPERRALLAAYGAELVLTDGGMSGAVAEAERLHREIPGSIIAGQFTNPANPDAHYRTTGPELWRDSGGALDALVAGVGTGGTITGAGRYLKERNSALQVIAVEPAASPLLTGGTAGPHGLQGIGADFIPQVLDRALCDQVMDVWEADAYAAARELAETEGILAGISSGAALWAALQLAKQPVWAGKRIAVILPDTGERYLSTPLFQSEF